MNHKIVNSPKWFGSNDQAQEALQLIKKIGWKMLKKQKQDLLLLQSLEILPKNIEDSIQGIIHLMDAIQDFAVDSLGVDEDTVFELYGDDEEKEKKAGVAFEKRQEKLFDHLKKKIK